jgi:hypothetical protein
VNEETIFAAALEKQDPAERRAYLDQACGGDPALRQQVEELLQSHDEAGGFLNVPAVQLAAAADAPGHDLTEGDATATPRPVSDQLGETQAEPAQPEREKDVLALLAPPHEPGSLGRLDHYEVLAVVGSGGMGVVLKARDTSLQRVVAIKLLAPQLAASGTARKRFVREAQAAAAVRDEHVVSIYAVQGTGPVPYLVMEYIEGATLEERIKQRGPVELKEILRIGLQIAEGLAAAHKHGLVHRDVKPANILLENGVERVKITDFGLARAVDDASLTQSGVIAGTPMFMSPEQAEGKYIDQRSDLFSLGSVLYAMCTGHAPFRASTTVAVLKRVCEDTPRSIREINPEIPEWLAAVIARLHAKQPAERFQSAKDVAELLNRHLAHLQHPSVVGPPVAEKPASPLLARPRRWALAATVLMCLFGGLGLTEATGVTKVAATAIRVLTPDGTPDGTLVVEVVDPGVSVTIDDGEMVVTSAEAKEIPLKPGLHQLRASKDGKVVHQEQVAVTKNVRQVVRVSPEAVLNAIRMDGGDPDYRAAEYVLSIGGTVQVNDVSHDLKAIGELPKEWFRLTNVSLQANKQASDAGLAHVFRDCNNLTLLQLQKTKVSAAKIDELKKALPRCKIEWNGGVIEPTAAPP